MDELDSGDDLFSSLDVREKAETVSRLLMSIPETEAEVICLRAYSELAFADIAQALRSPVSTVKSRFRYGIEKLRRLLDQERCTRK
jgi:RNA polymerase sigma-70 factor (ECF subfamily)